MPDRWSADRVHAPAAVRAVVEVALGELVAPGTEAQVLDRPRQPRLRRRERQHLADDLQRLTAFPVDVNPSGLGLADDLSSGFGGPHPVALRGFHAAHSSKRIRWNRRGCGAARQAPRACEGTPGATGTPSGPL